VINEINLIVFVYFTKDDDRRDPKQKDDVYISKERAITKKVEKFVTAY